MNSRKLPFGTCKLWHNHRQVRKTKERNIFILFFTEKRGSLEELSIKETESSKYSGFSRVRL